MFIEHIGTGHIGCKHLIVLGTFVRLGRVEAFDIGFDFLESVGLRPFDYAFDKSVFFHIGIKLFALLANKGSDVNK